MVSSTIFFYETLLCEARICDGQTEQQNIQKPLLQRDSTSETFFLRDADGVTDRLKKFCISEKPFFTRRGWCDGQTQQQNFFSETFFSRGADGVTDRLYSKIIFQKPYFREARTPRWSDSLFFARCRWCDGQTQQQNYFSETFSLRGVGHLNNNVIFQKPLFAKPKGVTDRLNNKIIFQKPFCSRGADV